MFLFLGGDNRILETYNILNKTEQCEIIGFDNSADTVFVTEKIKNADVIILPVPYTRDNCYIYTPFSDIKIKISDVLDNRKKDVPIIYGAADGSILDNGINILDIDEYKINNAFLTSEILLELIEVHYKCDLRSNILVTGYGKIAKNLIKNLLHTAKKIYIAVRNKELFDEIKKQGCIPFDITDINNFGHAVDIVINTVPCIYFKNKFFDKFSNIKYFDIASYPHGASQDILKTENKHLLLGLPGKYKPFDEALLIHKIIKDRLGGEAACSKD